MPWRAKHVATEVRTLNETQSGPPAISILCWPPEVPLEGIQRAMHKVPRLRHLASKWGVQLVLTLYLGVPVPRRAIQTHHFPKANDVAMASMAHN